jgi:hypothetical protein
MAEVFKMEGLKELDFALGELPKATERNNLVRTLKKEAVPVRDTWKDLAPRDEGQYAESITIGTRLTRRQAREARKEGKNFAEVYIGTDDPAGQQQEFGNINHPAQPSGRPAWEATKQGVVDGLAKTLGDEIEKSRARLARKSARLAKG